MSEIDRQSNFPDDGKGGCPFVGAVVLRYDNIGSTDAPTPFSTNWVLLDGSTISGGIWDAETAPDVDGKYFQAETSSGAGGTGGSSSHDHTISISTEVISTPCSGTGEYLVNSSTTGSSGNTPAYVRMEPWLRKE